MRKLDIIKTCLSELKELDSSETAKVSMLSIDELKRIQIESINKRMKEQIYKAHSDDIFYCDTMFVEKYLGYPYELELGQVIYIYPENNSIIAKSTAVEVTKIHKTNKYPNKKWWQFWVKKEECVEGYTLMVL